MKLKAKEKAKKIGATMKLIGYQFPKEVLKRLKSSSYTHDKVFGKKKGK